MRTRRFAPYNLGTALYKKGRFNEATLAFQESFLQTQWAKLMNFRISQRSITTWETPNLRVATSDAPSNLTNTRSAWIRKMPMHNTTSHWHNNS